MTIGKKVRDSVAKGIFVPTKPRLKLTPGESVRVIRELQGMSQNDLAAATGIPQSTISGIESGRINIGIARAKVLARALKTHPAVLVFSGWNVEKESAA